MLWILLPLTAAGVCLVLFLILLYLAKDERPCPQKPEGYGKPFKYYAQVEDDECSLT